MALGEWEAVEVAEGLAPNVRLGVGEVDCVELAEIVELGVMDAVPVPLEVGLPVSVPVGVALGVTLLERELLGVLEAEAPLVREGVGEALTVELAESVEEGVKDPVPVPLEVGVPVAVPVGVALGVALLERELLPELEGEAPAETEAVGEALVVVVVLTVVEGVRLAVPEPLDVGVPVAVELGVGGGVPELDRELLPVLEGEAPLVSEAVGEALVVELEESVEEGVGAAVPVGAAVRNSSSSFSGEVQDGMGVASRGSVPNARAAKRSRSLFDKAYFRALCVELH
jgi:hypothetical protein